SRRNAIRILIRAARQLHLVDAAFDPTVDMLIPSTDARIKRALTDEEELLGRLAADGTLAQTRRPSAWALGQATAVAGEQRAAIVRDLDLATARVWLRGTTNRAPRWGELTEWGVIRLEQRVEHLQGDPDAPLVRGRNATQRSGHTQACNGVREVL